MKKNQKQGKKYELEKGKGWNGGEIPRPGATLGDQIVTGDDELRDTENAFFFEGGDRSRPCDPLDCSLEGLVKLLRQNHVLSPKLLNSDARFWKENRNFGITSRSSTLIHHRILPMELKGDPRVVFSLKDSQLENLILKCQLLDHNKFQMFFFFKEILVAYLVKKL